MDYRLNAFSKRITFIHQDRPFGHDPRFARNRWDDSVILNLDTALEDTANNALLFPDLTDLQFSVAI